MILKGLLFFQLWQNTRKILLYQLSAASSTCTLASRSFHLPHRDSVPSPRHPPRLSPEWSQTALPLRVPEGVIVSAPASLRPRLPWDLIRDSDRLPLGKHCGAAFS